MLGKGLIIALKSAKRINDYYWYTHNSELCAKTNYIIELMDYPDSEEESSSCGERDGQEKVVTETETAILDEEDKEDSGMAATIARQTEGKTLIRLPISRSRLELGTFVSRGYSNYTAAAPP